MVVDRRVEDRAVFETAAVYMKYDDASWHYGGAFPEDLPDEAGATHIGMFVAWALLNGMAGELHVDEFPEDLQNLKDRGVTPGQFFLTACDGKFTDEDLTDEGNKFTEAYYAVKSGGYLNDYSIVLGSDLPTLYHIEDTWASFDKLKPILDERYSQWIDGRLELFDPETAKKKSSKSRWKFW